MVISVSSSFAYVNKEYSSELIIVLHLVLLALFQCYASLAEIVK